MSFRGIFLILFVLCAVPNIAYGFGPGRIVKILERTIARKVFTYSDKLNQGEKEVLERVRSCQRQGGRFDFKANRCIPRGQTPSREFPR